MNSSSTISISIPTRNRLGTIKRTIAHIYSQTVKDWELIISDNASDEPGKVEYLKELAASDPRVKLHLQPVNIGIHGNWNFNIMQCAGRYYIAVTDDDRWGEETFLEELLALHDGQTGCVFPNLAVDSPEGGSYDDKILTNVYSNSQTRYEMCETAVKDRHGIMMMGLFDLQVVSKEELVSVYDHGRHGHCEIGGMIRLVRNHPMKFCPQVTYVHSSYSGNYLLRCVPEVVMRDSGIGTFELLDELRLAAAKDPGYEKALAEQWKITFRYCRSLLDSYEIKDGVITPRPRKQKGPVRSFMSQKRRALKAWIKGKGSKS